MIIMAHLCYLMVIILILLLVNMKAAKTESCRDDEVSVRLVNGTSERNGRVELCWDNQWKAVCDSGWDQAEARTVCTELGYLSNNRRAIAVSGSQFGAAHEIHQLNQWNCGPLDVILAHCSKSIAHPPCSPSETAGVYCQGEDECYDGELRLMNGSSPSRYEGRVEICFSGVWGTICSDGWDSREATVVCRQLGILAQSLGIAVSLSDSYGEGEGPILLDRISCGKNDTRLADCISHGVTPGMVGDTCTHRKDAGVICRGGSNCRDGEIRLVDTQSQNQGMIEICFGGVWGTICGYEWDDSDARVACQQLGYIHGYATIYTVNSMETNIRHLGQVKCTGQEPRLMDCSHGDIGVHTCGLNSNENAAVVCSVAFPTVHSNIDNIDYVIYDSTSISAQATSTITHNNIILEYTNSINSSSTLTVAKVSIGSSSTMQLPIFLGAMIGAVVAGILTGISMIAIFRKRKHWIGNFTNHESANIIDTTTAISTDTDDPNIIGMKENEAYCPVPQSDPLEIQRNEAYGTLDSIIH